MHSGKSGEAMEKLHDLLEQQTFNMNRYTGKQWDDDEVRFIIKVIDVIVN